MCSSDLSVTRNNGAVTYNGANSAAMSKSRINGNETLKASVLDSDGYEWGIMQDGNPSSIPDLVTAATNG